MEIIIGMPVYNEEASLNLLLDKFVNIRATWGQAFKLVMVNDGSSDNTEAILKQYCSKHAFMKYINHDQNMGLGVAVQTLLDHAAGYYRDEDLLVTLDADNTQDPAIIPDMVAKLLTEDLDVVIASRFVKGGREIGLSLLRKVYSRGASLFFRLFFPIDNVRDYSCGFRAYRIGYLQRVMQLYQGQLVTTAGFDCMAEILAKFSKVGLVAGEYPLVLEYNLKTGASKMKVIKTVFGYLNLLKRVKQPVDESVDL